MREGVIIDCGRRKDGANPTKDDDYWLHLYVMLSRATRLEDILLVRAEDAEDIWHAGPPVGLARQLKKFAARTAKCRVDAERIARELGMTLKHDNVFLRAE